MDTKEHRILILEDVPVDAELMERQLKKGGLNFVSKRVDNREDFIAALSGFSPDLILPNSLHQTNTSPFFIISLRFNHSGSNFFFNKPAFSL